MINTEAPKLALGLDVGSVNVRAVVLDSWGKPHFIGEHRIEKGPLEAVRPLLEQVFVSVPAGNLSGASVTGSGREIFKGQEGWTLVGSPHAAIKGVKKDYPDVKTVVDVGGQSSIVVLLGGKETQWQAIRSPLCAAGTGRFLEQQASRLGIPIEDFGRLSTLWTQQPPRIAARCSVFAKSDLIHLQAKGWPIEAMVAGLSDSVARMIRAQWKGDFEAPIYFIGGVAGNEGVVKALEQVLGAKIIVPDQHANREAMGAASLALENKRPPASLYPTKKGENGIYYVSRKLSQVTHSNGWETQEPISDIGEVYLGVDVGSTSTKAVLIKPNGEVVAKTYLMTAGQPLEAIKQVMANLTAWEGKVNVKGVGVTGSGRYLVGNFIGADTVKNEITAQTRAAIHIDPEVDTIFELGGQDSKFVYLENGVALDYQMNKACAAGTGSFIDELAEQLGVSTRNGDFARLAFAADRQLDLGEKCAAFMSQAVTSAQHAGVHQGEIVASLSTSLARNYRSKVVGTRRVGDRVFLTGAVFYNEAVAAAFQTEFPGKTLVIPDHKEVTGAIGAALLSMEAMPENGQSLFKGFTNVANQTYKLTNFNCKKCENHCAISAMRTDDGEKAFYGSRCDLFDSVKSGQETSTPFDDRESLLFADYDPKKGKGVQVGIPRALMTHDLAPMLIGFLNSLGVRVKLSSATNSPIIEKASQHAYTDSCFPVKLLHGHVATLLQEGADYILIPNAIRMGEKSGDEDQRYSCPLVQAAPYITNSVFGLGEKLLDPVIDFSRGYHATIDSFTEIAMRLGFDKDTGTKAAVKGLRKQCEFEEKLREKGREILAELEKNPDSIGVVMLSRSYNAQDEGANAGMVKALRKLGVIPVPLDYLPIDEVDVKEISDRPYWNYERKILAASALIGKNKQLFGLFLSNFGCGPNSFIENIVKDMMGGKPLGMMEVDEHAAEAGYITRLEALVDTIRGYYKAGLQLSGDPEKYRRRVSSSVQSGQNLLVARMSDHAEVVAAAMRGFGVNATVLPESDERSMSLSGDVTSGKECLPFRDSLGAILRLNADGQLPPGGRCLMAGSFGPCRLGKYAQEQQKILDERGISLEVMTTVSNNAYADLGLGPRFELLAWQGALGVDNLQKLLWTTRPYEKTGGESDRAYNHYLSRLLTTVESHRPLDKLMAQAAGVFRDLRDPALPKRPKVGVNGEIYLRANRFCNQDLVRICEAQGLEVEVAPMSEWIKYVTKRNLEDGLVNRDPDRIIKGALRKIILDFYENRAFSQVSGALHEKEPSTEKLLKASSLYLPARNGSEAVLSIGSGVLQMADPHFAGVISVMPHGCMPGGIVAAFSEEISKVGGKPWISLTYDGFADKVNPEKIADFAEQLLHGAHQ